MPRRASVSGLLPLDVAESPWYADKPVAEFALTTKRKLVVSRGDDLNGKPIVRLRLHVWAGTAAAGAFEPTEHGFEIPIRHDLPANIGAAVARAAKVPL